MNYKIFKKIKEKIEVFEDANFVSLQGDNEVLIENSNNDIWSVPFSFENDQITLYGEKAQLVESKTQIIENIKSVNEVNSVILEAASSGDEDRYYEGLERLVDVFLEERKNKKEKTRKELLESSSFIEDDEELNEDNFLWEHQSERAKEFTRDFISYWEDKVNLIKSNFNDLYSAGFLFDENNNFKKEIIFDPIEILESYKNKQDNVKNFFENLSSLDEWYLKAEELGIMKESLNGISPLAKDWKIALFKNLVLQKRKGYEIPIHETVSELEEFTKQIIEESDMTMNIGLNSEKVPGSHNGENKMSFLKTSGTFTPTDLEKLISDFTRAMSMYQSSGFDKDTLGKISKYKDITDKMYRTNMIDDETVSKIITDFNTNFGPVKDSIYSPMMSFSGGNVY